MGSTYKSVIGLPALRLRVYHQLFSSAHKKAAYSSGSRRRLRRGRCYIQIRARTCLHRPCSFRLSGYGGGNDRPFLRWRWLRWRNSEIGRRRERTTLHGGRSSSLGNLGPSGLSRRCCISNQQRPSMSDLPATVFVFLATFPAASSKYLLTPPSLNAFQTMLPGATGKPSLS
jgi:hypothetical protein